jgi:hypothetical protein
MRNACALLYCHLWPVSFCHIISSSSIGTTTLSWVSACSTVVEHSQQEGLTECRCQRHVKLPTWRRTTDLERSNFRHKRPPASEATLTNPAAEGGSMGEKWPRILPKVTTSTSLLGSFTCRKARHGTDGFTPPPKNPTASAGFEPANLGTKGQHSSSRPPKPLPYYFTLSHKRFDFRNKTSEHETCAFILYTNAFEIFLIVGRT